MANHDGLLSLARLTEQLAAEGMTLSVIRKRVKNINFRVRGATLFVSAPLRLSDRQLFSSIAGRIDWAIAVHQRLKQLPSAQDAPMLWGTPLSMDAWASQHLSDKNQQKFSTLSDADKFTLIAKMEISRVLPELHSHWQAVVGKSASGFTVRSMTSRWGSCNTRTAKISLSTHLAKYPVDCLAYVLVHELCHLHHANHSAAFWAEVLRAMPDYRRYHDLLKGRGEL